MGAIISFRQDSSRATVGEISIASTECSTNQGFQSLITKNNVDYEFIYYGKVENFMG